MHPTGNLVVLVCRLFWGMVNMTSLIKKYHNEFKNQTRTVVDLTTAVFSQIEAKEPSVHAYISTFKEDALEKAAQIDAKFVKGEDLPLLAGIPIAIKDNMHIKNKRSTCGSKMLENFVAPFNATVVNHLEKQQAIFTGKVNMDEFAMGSSTENSAFFTTNNPWHPDYVPGGSSGGSAAAVAAGEAIVSLGSDTGGSIRQPAAFCGLVGLKPTYGRVSRYGLVAFASSLDQIGPFTRTVEDAAIVLESLCGQDKHDATSSNQAVPAFSKQLKKDIKGLKIAVPKELFGDVIDYKVKQRVAEALDVLVKQGASYEEVSMPSLNLSIATYYVIAPAEASSNLARFDGVRYTKRIENAANLTDMFTQTRGKYFGDEVKRRILLGTFALSSGYYDAYYLKAQKARTFIKQDFNKVFQKFDVVLSPTTPTMPFKKGEHTDDPVAMYLADLATIPANMTGLPAMSIPCGFVDGLPVGLQLVGKAFAESTLFNVGDCYQSVTDFHTKVPQGVSYEI